MPRRHIEGLRHHVNAQILGIVGVDVLRGSQRDIFIAQRRLNLRFVVGYFPQQVEEKLAGGAVSVPYEFRPEGAAGIGCSAPRRYFSLSMWASTSIISPYSSSSSRGAGEVLGTISKIMVK